MDWRQICAAVSGLFLVLAITGCNGPGLTPGNGTAPPDLQPVPAAGNLPAPEQLAALPFPGEFAELEAAGTHTINAVQDQIRLGSEYILHSANAVKNGDHAELVPGAGEASWAIYRFVDIADADIPQTLTVDFSAPLPATWYLGLADYSTGAWDWQVGGSAHAASTSASDALSIPAGADCITDAGYLYAAVLTWDAVPATVYSVTLATDINDLAPVALVATTPNHGNATLSVSFDASASFDRDAGGIVEYRWDWNNDGVVDHTSAAATASFNYGTHGEHVMRLEVSDGDGLSDAVAATITVQGWSRTFGNSEVDAIEDMAIDARGDAYAIGSAVNPLGGVIELLLIKYDRFGQVLWQKCLPGALNTRGAGIRRLADGTLLIAGATQNMGAGSYDVLLFNIDTAGQVLWARTWGQDGSEMVRDMAVDGNGNIYITGDTTSFGVSGTDILVARFKPDGTPDWARTWGLLEGENAWALSVDSSSNCYIAGNTGSFTPPLVDSIMLKFDATGALQLKRRYSEILSDNGYAIGTDYQGNIYLAGDLMDGNWPLQVVKFDAGGVLQWAKLWDTGDRAKASDMVVTGNMFFPVRLHIAGNTYGATSDKDLLWLTMGASGTVLMEKSWIAPGTQDGQSITQGSGGAYLIGGWAQDNNGVWLDAPGTVTDGAGTVSTPAVNAVEATGLTEVQTFTLTDAAGTQDTGGGGVYDALAMCFFEDDL